jgi:SAM-dependent methyltransferase
VSLWNDRVVPRVTDFALKGRAVGASRVETCAGLAGRVLEIGFGSGLNVAHYPAEVTAVGAVEPSDLAWSMSERRRARSTVSVERIGLDGQAVTAEDASYDSALCTFSLCTIPDAVAALEEVRRVVRPGGRLHFLEHGLSDDGGTQRWQHRLDPWQQRLAGGCHLTRDPRLLLEQAGLDLEDVVVGELPGFSGPKALTYGYRGIARV